MKKIEKLLKTVFTVILTATILTSCGIGDSNENYLSETTTNTTTTTVKSTSKPSNTSNVTEASKSTTTVKTANKNEDKGKDRDNTGEKNPTFKDTTAMKIVKDMKIGWNLGNTLDSVHWETGNNLPTKPSDLKLRGVIPSLLKG